MSSSATRSPPSSDTDHTDLTREELDEVRHLRQVEADFEKWVVSFKEIKQPDGLWTLQVRYDRHTATPASSPVMAGAALGGGLGAAVGGVVGAAAGAALGAAAGAAFGGDGASAPAVGAKPPRDVATALRDAAGRVGVDPEVLASIAFIESSFDPAARNPRSSAFGLFQFIDSTWNDVVAKHGAAHDMTAADRKDLDCQCVMGAEFLRDNAGFLAGKLGRKPDAGECYAAHFFGTGGAASFFAHDDATRADAALGQRAGSVIGANESIFLDHGRMRTVGEVRALFDDKMAKAAAEARRRLGASAPAAAPKARSGPVAAAEPSWLGTARGELGVKEVDGSGNNPRVMEYFSWTSLGSQPDEVPWCGAFVSFCLGKAGMIEKGKGSARAGNWLTWGVPLDQPRPGCVVVLKPHAPTASGHVAFWVGENGNRVRLLGGNQHDQVNITEFPSTEVRPSGYRWPANA